MRFQPAPLLYLIGFDREMMETFRKYFLTLAILLLSGYSFLCSNFHHSRVYCFAIKRLGHLESGQSDNALSTKNTRVGNITPDAKKGFGIYSENKEEESYSFSPVRKSLEAGNYLTSICACISRYFFRYEALRISCSEFHYHFLAHKYILFRVIRIWFQLTHHHKIFNKI